MDGKVMSDSIRHTNSSWIMAPGLDTLASAIAEAIPAPTSLNTTMEQMLKKRKAASEELFPHCSPRKNDELDKTLLLVDVLAAAAVLSPSWPSSKSTIYQHDLYINPSDGTNNGLSSIKSVPSLYAEIDTAQNNQNNQNVSKTLQNIPRAVQNFPKTISRIKSIKKASSRRSIQRTAQQAKAKASITSSMQSMYPAYSPTPLSIPVLGLGSGQISVRGLDLASGLGLGQNQGVGQDLGLGVGQGSSQSSVLVPSSSSGKTSGKDMKNKSSTDTVKHSSETDTSESDEDGQKKRNPSTSSTAQIPPGFESSFPNGQLNKPVPPRLLTVRERHRECNRLVARKTRVKKKIELDLLQNSFNDFRNKNDVLRNLLKEAVTRDICSHILLDCNFQLPNDVVAAVAEMMAGRECQHYITLGKVTAAMRSFCITNPTVRDNPIAYASRGFGELTGYDPQAIIGYNCRFLQGTDTDLIEIYRLNQAVEKSHSVQVVLKNYRKNGTAFWNLTHISPVLNAYGKVVLFINCYSEVFQVFNKKGDEMFWTKDTSTSVLGGESQENGPTINNEGMNGSVTGSSHIPSALPLSLPLPTLSVPLSPRPPAVPVSVPIPASVPAVSVSAISLQQPQPTPHSVLSHSPDTDTNRYGQEIADTTTDTTTDTVTTQSTPMTSTTTTVSDSSGASSRGSDSNGNGNGAIVKDSGSGSAIVSARGGGSVLVNPVISGCGGGSVSGSSSGSNSDSGGGNGNGVSGSGTDISLKFLTKEEPYFHILNPASTPVLTDAYVLTNINVRNMNCRDNDKNLGNKENFIDKGEPI